MSEEPTGAVLEFAQQKYGKDSPQYQAFKVSYLNQDLINSLGNKFYRLRADVMAAYGSAGVTLGVAAEKGLYPDIVQNAFIVVKELTAQVPQIGPEAVKFLDKIQPGDVPTLVALGGATLIAAAGAETIFAKELKGQTGERLKVIAGTMAAKAENMAQNLKARLQGAPKAI